MPDEFDNHAPKLESPASRHFTIAPGAGNLPYVTRAVYVNAGGTATIEDIAGTQVTYNLVAGQILPLRAVKVTAASATLVGWF